MVLIPVLCPHCQSDQVIRGGKTKAGKQRYKCQNSDCPHYSFQLELIYKGRSPEVKEQIIDRIVLTRLCDIFQCNFFKEL